MTSDLPELRRPDGSLRCIGEQVSQRRCDSIQLWFPHFTLLVDSAELRHDIQYSL